MAAFIRTLTPPGVVVRAERLFDARRIRRTPRLTLEWVLDANGALVSRWRAPHEATSNPDVEPARLVAAG